jgi:hypothetical protein
VIIGDVETMWELCGIGALQSVSSQENCAASEIFLAQKSPVFMRLSRASSKIFRKSCRPGVASALGLCYNNQVSRERYCRQRMRAKL